MESILITGANGLLGQKLVDLITEENQFKLIATGRGENRNSNADKYLYESMDITSPEEVMAIISKHKPTYIIHTAAMTNVDQCEQDPEGCELQNVIAVKNIVNAAEANNSFLLHLSTDFIFDGTKGPLTEDEKANPISIYGESKLKAEEIVINSKLNWSIARTVLVYGIVNDMSRSNLVLWVKKSLEDKKQIQVVNDQWRTPTLAEDLAMGCYLIIKNKAKGIYNISGPDFLTPYEMALQTAEFFNLDKSYITESDSSKFTQPAKRPPKTGFIIDKAKKDLGYNPKTFKEGIALLAKQINK